MPAQSIVGVYRIVFVLVLVAVLAPPALASPAQRSLIVIGDSLSVDTAPYLDSELEHWRVRSDAVIGRGSTVGLEILAARENLPDVVVMALGTNDDPAQPDSYRALVRRSERIAAGRCLIWVTIAAPAYEGTSYSVLNDVLRRRDAANPAMRLVDWHAIVTRRPELLDVDRTHATPEGSEVRAQAIADAARACVPSR